ncbi:MAG: hypothetical protein JKY42_06190 [Flavobacteriales bacterium]|nr:hypothetical protein [Flavobacteriales bacterium]
MRLLLLIFCFGMISYSSTAQNSFQIQNNTSEKTKTYKTGDKILFKTQDSDLLHIGKLDSITPSSIIVSGSEVLYSELSYLISERKWRKRIKPIAAVGVLTGFVWTWAGNLWTIAGIGGNQRFLFTGPANIIIGRSIKFVSLLPFIIGEGKFSIPNKWHVVNATIQNSEESILKD